MTVKDLITRLLDEPMNAEILLQTYYNNPVESYHNNVRSVTRGVFFDIDSIEHWASNCILINFTDWRKETHLVDDRILDSLAVITMITDLEEEFHVEIKAEEITRENFNSAEAIWKMICRLKEK